MSYRQISRHPFQLLLYFTLGLVCVTYVVGQPTPLLKKNGANE